MQNARKLSDITRAKNTVSQIIRAMYETGVTPEGIRKSISAADEIVELVKSDDFIDSIKIFKEYDPYALTHPFMVSLMSVMICRKLDWNTERTLKAVSLGGLLHNIGMTKMPDNVKYKHPEDLSKEEFLIYKTHPEVGMSIAGQYPEIPAAVLQIIYQHHEINGKGYPNSLTDLKIFPLAKIVCLADNYTRYILEKNILMVDGLRPFITNQATNIQHDVDLIRAMLKSFIKEEKKK